jgi:hypothetical protein
VTYKDDCEGIRQQISLLQIVKRRIFDDKFVSFGMHQPAEAKGLLGWIEVTLTPHGYLAVTGDYETCVFARFSGDHWRGAIHWIGRNAMPSGYVLEKARLGMGIDMVQIDADALRSGIASLVEDEIIDHVLAEECFLLVTHDEFDSLEHAMWGIRQLLYADGVEGEDFQDPGEVPNLAVVAATAVLHRLDELLDAEEKAATPEVQALIDKYEKDVIRPEVLAFARDMELKLRANDHKGGWCECSKHHLSQLLLGELVELLAALGYKKPTIHLMVDAACDSITWTDFQADPKLEAVDVGNIAMMLHDNLTHKRF